MNIRRSIVVVIITVLCVMITSTVKAQTTHWIEAIDSNIVEIDVRKDGSIGVRESINYDFGAQQRHGIFRTIPYIKTNEEGKKFVLDIDNVKVVNEVGDRYQFKPTKSNGELTFKIGDPDKTISGKHQYNISYDVKGALTYFSDHDELYWNAIGTQWTVSQTNVSVRVRMPQSVAGQDLKLACYTGAAGSQLADCGFRTEADAVIFEPSGELGPSQGMTIVVGFPRGMVAVLEPRPYVSFWDTILGKGVIAMGLLAALWWYVGYPIKIALKWLREGRDPRVAGSGVASAWFDPPKDTNGHFFTPAQTGALIDQTVHDRDVVATIVELARAGHIRIEQRSKKDFYLHATTPKKASTISNAERTFLDQIFGGLTEIRIKDTDLISAFSEFKKDTYANLVKQGYFPSDPSKIRAFYNGIVFAGLMTMNPLLVVCSFVFGRSLGRRSAAGVVASNTARSLKNFLGSQQRQLEFQADRQMMFERLLPYAVAFGVERVWAKRFDDMELKQPSWYQSYDSSSFRAGYLGSSLHNMSSSAVAAATPVSSSSGFSSGGSGGSSGGGGGGGGGGSW